VPPTPPVPAPRNGPSSRARSRQEPQDVEENAAQGLYDEKQDDFESRAAKACSMILSSVSPAFQQFIYAMTDPRQM
jgi:hypothetical protein